MRRVLLVGATSAIAMETARLLAARGDALYLVARDPKRLEAVAADLRLRGSPSVHAETMDANETDKHAGLVERAAQAMGGLDTALVAHGTLPDQKACERDFELARREIATNFLSVASLLTHVANRFEAQRGGSIAVVSSVAGDRGRQSNYVYGTAKAATSTFLQGLRNRLQPAGVHVLTVKPGFVDTPMTAHLPKNALFAPPQRIARGIVRALDKRKDVVYLPWFWRPILFLIRATPEAIFKRTRL